HLGTNETFTVGEASGAKPAVDFTLPSEKLGTSRLPVVKRVDGAPVLAIPSDASGGVTRHRQTSPLHPIRPSASAAQELSGAAGWALPPDTEVRVELADLAFVVRTTKAGKPVPHGIGSELDLASASYFGASFLSAAALLAAAAFFMPPMGLTS